MSNGRPLRRAVARWCAEHPFTAATAEINRKLEAGLALSRRERRELARARRAGRVAARRAADGGGA